MKKIYALCILLLFATLIIAKPYTQQGIAYLYDYKTKTKSPVANVSLTVAYAKGPAVSRADGTFTIEFQDFGAGKKLAFEKQPFCQGLIVLNKNASLPKEIRPIIRDELEPAGGVLADEVQMGGIPSIDGGAHAQSAIIERQCAVVETYKWVPRTHTSCSGWVFITVEHITATQHC